MVKKLNEIDNIKQSLKELNELYIVMTNKINALNIYYAKVLGEKNGRK